MIVSNSIANHVCLVLGLLSLFCPESLAQAPYFDLERLLNNGATCSDLADFMKAPYVEITTEADCAKASDYFEGFGYNPYGGVVNDATKTPGCILRLDSNADIVFNTASPGDPADGSSGPVCMLQSSTNSGGDPHFIGFNQKTVTYQGECTLILLQSPAATASQEDVVIHVRTTRKMDFSYISGVAMMIGEDIIEVKSNAELLINGAAMAVPSASDHAAAVASSSTSTSTNLTLSGLPFAIRKTTKGTKNNIVAYTFDIGNGRLIDIQANKKRSMMFVRTKGNFPSETQGLLGTPGQMEMMSRDGTKLSEQSVEAYGESWQVKNTDAQLFQEALGPQYPEKCLYEDAPGATAQLRGRRKLLGKKIVSMDEAVAACDGVVGSNKRQLCIQDTIAMGDLEIRDDPFYSANEDY